MILGMTGVIAGSSSCNPYNKSRSNTSKYNACVYYIIHIQVCIICIMVGMMGIIVGIMVGIIVFIMVGIIGATVGMIVGMLVGIICVTVGIIGDEICVIADITVW